MLNIAPIGDNSPPTSSITLRPYQETCVQRVLEAYRSQPHGGSALIILPTGGGKTLVFAEIARRLGLVTLIIAHREELLTQAADKYRLVDPTAIIGQVGAGHHEWGTPVTVASVQTISRPEHLKTLRRFNYGLAIVDECFPAGTLIDGKPIEQIKVGDMVTAFDEHTNTIAKKRVVRAFRRPVGQCLMRITAGSTAVVCTLNHPFYTKSGWKPAEQLVPQEEVLYGGDARTLHSLSTLVPSDQKMAERPPQKRQKSVLFRYMQKGNSGQTFLRDNGEDQPKIRLTAYENPQSDASGSLQEQDAGNVTSHGTCTQDSWRQWERTNDSAAITSRNAGLRVVHGISRQNRCAQGQSSAYCQQLQAGSGQSIDQTGNRGGWRISSLSGSPSTGSQERTSVAWVRVDRLEVYEPGSDGTFAGLCPDGTVFNFEVEDYHTYLANGFVVHNCHHATSASYRAVLEALPYAFVVAVTATPDRLDGQSIETMFGSPVFSASIIEMVAQGYLCDLRAIAVKTATSLDGVLTQAGDFKPDELEEIVDTQERNERVVQAYLEHAAGRQTLCFAVTVKHAQHLAETFTRFAVSSAVVSGETPPEERRQRLTAYERGTLTVLCNVGVLTEGYDHPATSCIILARPTQSRALFVQCLDQATEILAPDGWKAHGEVKNNDLVAGFDKDSGEIRWVPVINTFERSLGEEETMFALQSPTLDIRVTGGHRMVYRTRYGRKRARTAWDFIKAQDLYRRDLEYEIPIAGNQVASGVPLTDDELRFIGWFLTDGTLNKRTGGIAITQSAHQPHHQAIQNCLRGCGFKYTTREEVPNTQYNANSNRIIYYISKGKPRGSDKHLTGWGRLEPYIDKNFSPHLDNVTAEQLGVLLEAIHLGDGHKQLGQTWTRRSYHICSGNPTFTKNLQSLCVRRGFKCNVSTYTPKIGQPLFMLHIKKTTVRYVGGRTTLDRPRLEISPSVAGESVWCIENQLGTLVTRRNGKVAIVGNCIGRGTRLAPGKRDCIILDVTDNCLKLRLQPVTLGVALGKVLKDGESVIEAMVREVEEEQKKTSEPGRELQRRARVTKREQDLLLNLLAPMNWQRRANGSYWLEVGKQKHRITLIPSEEITGTYTVRAALAPDYEWQTWLSNAPLSWAQQHAETKARLLESNGNALLVDNTASWRGKPPSFKQLRTLRHLGIQHTAEITSGEASDLIRQAFADQKRARAEKQLSAQPQQGKATTTKRKGPKRW